MRGVIFAPQRNDPGYPADATGAFQPEARQFARLHALPAPIRFDNEVAAGATDAQKWQIARRMRNTIIDGIRDADGPLEVIAYFGHGTPSALRSAGMNFMRMPHIPDLAAAIRGNASSDAIVVLYACSAGTFGGFAERLAEQINSGGSSRVVYGHAIAGHTSRNPYKTRFPDAQYVVHPDSTFFDTWRARLAGTDLRLRYPFMSQEQILTGLGGSAEWECWLRRPTQATRVKMYNGGIIGVFPTAAAAEREMGADRPWRKSDGWECWLRKDSDAVRVGRYDNGLIAVYRSETAARAENREDALRGRAPRSVWKKMRMAA